MIGFRPGFRTCESLELLISCFQPAVHKGGLTFDDIVDSYVTLPCVSKHISLQHVDCVVVLESLVTPRVES